MSDENSPQVPQSPEVEPAGVREELHQEEQTHVGERREAGPEQQSMGQHMGAVDGETSLVRAPMTGPGDIIDGEDYDDIIDPREELPPG